MTVTRPIDPAAAPPAGRAADRIFLRDHVVAAEIGAFQAERGRRQRLRFALWADLTAPAGGAVRDDVDGIVSYDIFAEAVADALAEDRLNLLESLAERIAARLLSVAGLARVGVSIEKLDRPGGTLGVRIERDAAPAALVPAPADRAAALAPDRAARIVLLGAGAASRPGLAARLDAEGLPTILCVAAPRNAEAGLPAPVRRRIDCLGFEQAAWRLAAQDRRFVVVDSRTELDWGLRNGQLSVWAPSKMVADARHGLPRTSVTMEDLSLWLAERLGIGRLDLAGAAPPSGPRPDGLVLGNWTGG